MGLLNLILVKDYIQTWKNYIDWQKNNYYLTHVTEREYAYLALRGLDFSWAIQGVNGK